MDITTQLLIWAQAQAFAIAAHTVPDWLAPYYQAVADSLLAVLRSFGWPV